MRGQAVQGDRVVARARPSAPRRAGTARAATCARRPSTGRRPSIPTRRCRARRRPRLRPAASVVTRNRAAVRRGGAGHLRHERVRASSAGVATTTSRPGLRAEHHQRVGDVVAVADVDELQPVQVAEALAQRQQIGERLARVVVGGEHVDDRHRGVLGQLLDQLVRARADRDRVRPCATARAPCRAVTRRVRAASRRGAGSAAWPPSSCTPTSNEIRVRVDGFWKISATLLPASAREPAGRASARPRGRAARRAHRW